jgi:hypothetical protein
MKIRTGFVSNSSSSSFILILDTLPKSVEELIGMLDFENASRKFTQEQYASEVFKDIIEAEEPDDEEIHDLLENLVFVENLQEYYSVVKGEDRTLLDQKIEKIVNSKVESFKIFSSLEHGCLFSKINHIYVNQH